MKVIKWVFKFVLFAAGLAIAGFLAWLFYKAGMWIAGK